VVLKLVLAEITTAAFDTQRSIRRRSWAVGQRDPLGRRVRRFVRRFVPPWVTAIRTHYKHHGILPRILNPQTFNEKLCHRKIFDRREILTQFADKYAVRDYVEQRLGVEVLPKLYHCTRHPADIPFSSLPRRFVVKPTHGCGWVRLVEDKSTLNEDALIAECNDWMNQRYYDLTREWQYKNVTPRIIVEEFIDDGSGGAPVDYKLMVFHGTVRIIHVHKDRFSAHKVTYYDRSWRKLEVLGLGEGVHDVIDDIPRPERLDEMIAAAEALGEGIDFVRADFYATKDRICFGELTNTPGNGVIRYHPAEFDLYIGQFWNVKRK
jgi:TupA-like ATPgrasp